MKSKMAASSISLGNPLSKESERAESTEFTGGETLYEEALAEGRDLLSRTLARGAERFASAPNTPRAA